MNSPARATISVSIAGDLYEQAKTDARGEHRNLPGQIEYSAKVGRGAALNNPDLPVSFITEALASLAEPHDQATTFVPRSQGR